jgi:hypothetical protein
MFTEQMSQGLSCADKIDPSNAAASTYTSTYLDMQKFRRAMYEIQIGTMAASSTLDANLQSCANSNFASSVHNITNSNITQVVNTSTGNTRVTIEVRDLQVATQNPGDRYVRLRVVVGTAAVFFGATGWGSDAPQKPASAQDSLQNGNVNQRVVVTP